MTVAFLFSFCTLALGFNIANPFALHYNTTMSMHPIESFFILGALFILTTKLSLSLKYVLAVTVMSLANSVKYLFMPGLWLLLGWITIKERKNPKIIFISCLTALIVLVSVNLPFFLIARERFIFGVTWGMKAEYINQLGLPKLNMFENVLYMIPVIQDFFIVYLILLAWAIYLWIKRDKQKSITSYLGSCPVLCLIGLIVIFYELMVLSARHSYTYPIRRSYYFILATVLTGVGIIKILRYLKDENSRLLWRIFIALLIIFTPFLQSRPWEIVNFGWDRTDIQCVSKVADSIRRYTGINAKVFTFTPAFAACARREPLKGMESDMLSYYPLWTAQRCKKLGLLNPEILEGYLRRKEADILVLTQKRFFEPEGRAVLLKNSLPKLIKAIEENYYLKEKLSFPDIYRGDVYIYLRKE